MTDEPATPSSTWPKTSCPNVDAAPSNHSQSFSPDLVTVNLPSLCDNAPGLVLHGAFHRSTANVCSAPSLSRGRDLTSTASSLPPVPNYCHICADIAPNRARPDLYAAHESGQRRSRSKQALDHRHRHHSLPYDRASPVVRQDPDAREEQSPYHKHGENPLQDECNSLEWESHLLELEAADLDYEASPLEEAAHPLGEQDA